MGGFPMRLGWVFLAMAAAFGVAAAQDTTTSFEVARDVREAERKALVARNLPLTDAEAESFWPEYNEYRDRVKDVELGIIQAVTRYAENYQNLSEEVARELLDNALALEDRRDTLKDEHLNSLEDVLPATKRLRYFQIDRLLDARQRLAISQRIPLPRTGGPDAAQPQ